MEYMLYFIQYLYMFLAARATMLGGRWPHPTVCYVYNVCIYYIRIHTPRTQMTQTI